MLGYILGACLESTWPWSGLHQWRRESGYGSQIGGALLEGVVTFFEYSVQLYIPSICQFWHVISAYKSKSKSKYGSQIGGGVVREGGYYLYIAHNDEQISIAFKKKNLQDQD